MMDDGLVLCLGTAGWLATETRETACYLVPSGNSVILLDAGSGMKRLLRPPEVYEKAQEVHLFLSHYHLDHTVGLTYAPAVFLGKKVTFYLPAKQISGVRPQDFLSTFFGSFLFPVQMKDLPFEWSVEEYGEGEIVIGNRRARVWKQVHTPFSAGIVLDEQIGYMTDAVYDPGLAKEVAGLQVLLIAVMFNHKRVGNPSDLSYNGHMTSEGARRILLEANPKRAYAIHISPLYGPEERGEMIGRLRAQGISITEAADRQWISAEPAM